MELHGTPGGGPAYSGRTRALTVANFQPSSVRTHAAM
jgi:hypothetical protein